MSAKIKKVKLICAGCGGKIKKGDQALHIKGTDDYLHPSFLMNGDESCQVKYLTKKMGDGFQMTLVKI